MKNFKPDEIVPDSGKYFELMQNGQKISEITCIKGELFPPTLGKGNYYELKTVSIRQPIPVFIENIQPSLNKI